MILRLRMFVVFTLHLLPEVFRTQHIDSYSLLLVYYTEYTVYTLTCNDVTNCCQLILVKSL